MLYPADHPQPLPESDSLNRTSLNAIDELSFLELVYVLCHTGLVLSVLHNAHADPGDFGCGTELAHSIVELVLTELTCSEIISTRTEIARTWSPGVREQRSVEESFVDAGGVNWKSEEVIKRAVAEGRWMRGGWGGEAEVQYQGRGNRDEDGIAEGAEG